MFGLCLDSATATGGPTTTGSNVGIPEEFAMGNSARSQRRLRPCAGAAALAFTICLSLQQEAEAAEQRVRRSATDRNNARLMSQSQPWRAQDEQPEEPP